jgi:hypothetical protein
MQPSAILVIFGSAKLGLETDRERERGRVRVRERELEREREGGRERERGATDATRHICKVQRQ